MLLEEIDTAELSRHAVADQQVLADSRRLTLTLKTDGDVMVTSDREKLGTVLSNIISNSIKHTPPGGSIELSVTREGGGVTVTVSDTGEGIHPDDIPHIWDRFYKSPHSELSRDDGSGIGMHIVGSIFELLGYPHYIDSVLGEGTTVTFTIPDVDPSSPE
ncbi:Adaptive-response sensory-kinase SasA [bioreactor metagenome]|uniref:histidine kinase n=1 Tax=bioreactor metagenome TaxID=1076179 RepID=A0A645AQ14_9ZZZZ